MSKRRQKYRLSRIASPQPMPDTATQQAPYRNLWEERLPQLWAEREAVLADLERADELLPGCSYGTYMSNRQPISAGTLLRCWMRGDLMPYIDKQPACDWRLFRFGGSPLSGRCMVWSAFNIVTGEVVDYQDPDEKRHGLFPGNVMKHIHAYQQTAISSSK